MDMIAIEVNSIINNKEMNIIPSEAVVNMIILLQTAVFDSCLCRWHPTVPYIVVIFVDLWVHVVAVTKTWT
jgi:hypothetical protein